MEISERKDIHAKCLVILEMIGNATHWIDFSVDALNRFNNAQPGDPILINSTQDGIVNQWQRFVRIRKRLALYYTNTLEKLLP